MNGSGRVGIERVGGAAGQIRSLDSSRQLYLVAGELPASVSSNLDTHGSESRLSCARVESVVAADSDLFGQESDAVGVPGARADRADRR